MPHSTPRRRASPGLSVLLAIAFTLASAVTLHAQVLSDPRIAEFDPSPDHWEVLDSGLPAVLRYELAFYLIGAAEPFVTMDMGKPTPEADGKIRYDFASGAGAWPLPGGDYEARVSAVGPEGSSVSDPSNPFTFTTGFPCTISLSATAASVPASGGRYAVDVSTARGCEWAATTALPWVALWTAGGSGSGTAPFEVSANSSSSSRTGTIEIGGQALALRQEGASFTLTIERPAGGVVKAAGIINCGPRSGRCTVTMPAPMNIGLHAVSDRGYTFSGWTGDCTGPSPDLLLQLTGAKSCGAAFTATSPSAAVPRKASGSR
jgi:hypothetical protein